MKSTLHFVLPLTAWLAMIAPAGAQQSSGVQAPDDMRSAPKATVVDDNAKTPATEEAADSAWKKGRPITMQYMRALDQRGTNVFETSKAPGSPMRMLGAPRFSFAGGQSDKSGKWPSRV